MKLARKTVVFRCDASERIGSGHVMRCLTLADMIAQNGGDCHFICRTLPGHLIDHIIRRGHTTHALSSPVQPVGADWLGVPLTQEITESAAVIAGLPVDRIIVDHYGLDAVWETEVGPVGCPVMAIDDLADRSHACDILLDQNLGRDAKDYDGLVPEGCQRLIGTSYALLRPEFAAARPASLVRRKTAQLRHIMISMGGADAGNATTRVLDVLAAQKGLPDGLHITVVMGSSALHLGTVQERARRMPVPTDVRVNVSNMAALMCTSDLAIGAAGGTSWERCCLGLPTLMLVLADNQGSAATALAEKGAAILIGDARDPHWSHKLPIIMDAVSDSMSLQSITYVAASLCDGNGAKRVLAAIGETDGYLRPARMSDAENIFEWRYSQNSAHFYRSIGIPDMAAHKAWLDRAFQNPAMDLRVFSQGGHDIAHVRFDINAANLTQAEIGICVSSAVRGKGLGTRILKAAIEAPPPNVVELLAEVHEDNIALRRIFEKIGFRQKKRVGPFLYLVLTFPNSASHNTGSSKGHSE